MSQKGPVKENSYKCSEQSQRNKRASQTKEEDKKMDRYTGEIKNNSNKSR
jgi:hypothetical protein